MDYKYDLNDILITPEVQSDVVSRDEISVIREDDFLPIFVAPMDTVIDTENYNKFLDNKIRVCLPRKKEKLPIAEYNMNAKLDVLFISRSLNEVIEEFEEYSHYNHVNILIDMANGHMSKLTETVKMVKDKYGDKVTLMVGNIANPETYKLLSEAGADYIRVSIGSGNACLTSEQTSIGYPMGSLIKECYEISCTLDKPASIVADGGMKNYSDIIKALALGADAVMIGSLFNKALESCGQTYWKSFKLSEKTAKSFFNFGVKLHKNFRGMSTKEVQKDWGKNILRTSEGIVKKQPVMYRLDSWIENFKDYLKSAMSYTNSRRLIDFIGNVKYTLITPESKSRYKK